MTIESFIFYLCGYRVIAELNLAIEFSQAIEWYDRAIAEAKTNQFLEQEAIANECAAKFCREWSQEKIADTYMQAADDCYVQAGAIAKGNVNLDIAAQTVNIQLKQSHLEIVLKDRQAMEIALRQSEQRYQKLADNIPGVIYQLRLAPDGSTAYPYMSSGCYELFHLSPAAVMADSNCLLDLIHPDDLPEFHRVMAESAQNLTPKLWEGRAILSSGEIKCVKSASRPELQPDGAIVWDGVLLDITDRKQVETELYQTNHR